MATRLRDLTAQTGAPTAGAPHREVRDIHVRQLPPGVPGTAAIQGAPRTIAVQVPEIRPRVVRDTEAQAAVREVRAHSGVLRPHRDHPGHVLPEVVEGRNNSLISSTKHS